MIITKDSGLNKTIYGEIQAPVAQYLTDREEQFKGRSALPYLFATDKTSNFAETYASETALGDFEATGESGKYPDNDFQESYKKIIYPHTWKNQFTISQEMIEDAKMGKIKKGAGSFMTSFDRTREKFGAAIYSNGLSTSMTFSNRAFDIAVADAKALYATDHPSITGGADQTNLFNDEFSYDILAYAEGKMQNFKDDNGNLLNVQPNTILCPYSTAADVNQFKTMIEVLGGDENPTTADRSVSFHAGRWNIIKWPYLTAPAGLTGGKSYFYLTDSEYIQEYMAMVWQERVELAVKSYIDENTDNNIWKGRARYGGSGTDWRFTSAFIPGSAGGSVTA